MFFIILKLINNIFAYIKNHNYTSLMNILNKNLDNFEALIFDLDGTLINSMPIHNKAWMDTFAAHGAPVEEEFLQETAGMASVRIIEILNKRRGIALDTKIVAAQKRQAYLKRIEEVQIVPELMEVVKKYHGIKPMGIVTGGSHAVVDMLLPKLGIDHYFSSIVCADDTEQGKDTIAPYELAKKQLGINLKKSLFFDDGDVGLKGATLAGMDVIHIDITDKRIFIK